MRKASDAREGRVDDRAVGGIGESARACVEDDLVCIACLGREPPAEQVGRLLRACSRQGEAARGLLIDRLPNREDPECGHDPGDHDHSAMSRRPARDSEH
jgi:hypothetical protein